MRKVFIPVLLSALVLPGAGQLYNKERAKGIILIGLTAGVMVAFFIGFTLALARIMPPDVTFLTPDQAKAMVTRITLEHGDYLRTFELLALAIWGYGVVDAYLGARERSIAKTSGL